MLVNKDFVPEKPIKATLIKVPDSYAALALLLEMANKNTPEKTGIASNCSIDPSAKIGEKAYIGAFAVIEEKVVIGNNCKIYPQVYIGDNVTIGDNTIVYPGVKIYRDCVIGSNCIIHSGCRDWSRRIWIQSREGRISQNSTNRQCDYRR